MNVDMFIRSGIGFLEMFYFRLQLLGLTYLSQFSIGGCIDYGLFPIITLLSNFLDSLDSWGLSDVKFETNDHFGLQEDMALTESIRKL